jgi:hypothetical protein
MTRNLPDDPRESLDRALDALPREVLPARDLWAGIQSQLGGGAESMATPPRQAWGWQIAAAVALVAVTALVTAALLRREAPPEVAHVPAPALPAAVQAVPASFGPSHQLSPEYDQARRQLTALLQQRIDRMPPSARDKLEDNLAQLRRAAGEINAALAQSPGDPLLEELLLSTYQQELAVLAAANQLTAAGGAGPTSDSSRIQL